MRIQHNIMAMNAYRNFGKNTSALSKNLEKLSSGYKINRAGDDAAGLAISEKMRAQITGLQQAQSNAKSGINLVQTAEGALQEVHDMLNRMVKLADQSANGTYDDTTDRANLQKEVEALQSEIDRIAKSANFNGIKLLDGSMTTAAEPADVVTGLDPTDLQNVVLHKDGVATQINPELSIDLSALSYKAIGNDGTLTLDIGGEAITTAALAADSTAEEIAEALKTAINANASGKTEDDGTTAINGIVIGDFAYTAEVSGSTLTLKLAANQTLEEGDDYDVNKTISIVSDDDTKGTLSGTINNGAIKVTAGAAVTDPALAKADFQLTEDMLAEGHKLTIGDQTFVFTQDGSTQAEGSDILIDLQGVDAAELLKEAANKIADKINAGNSVFTVGHGGNDGLITLQEVTGGATGVDLTTAEKIAEQIKFAEPGQLTAEEQKYAPLTLQIGDTSEAFNKLTLEIQNMHADALGVGSAISVANQADAADAVDAIKAAINTVSSVRGDLGAVQNRLDHTINNLSVMTENIQDAESTIRDTDVAEEMMAYTKNNILIQSAQAMLAQANQVPQGVLQLLQ